LQNILYKTLFATNFVGNTCEFYNFVGNNYPQRNYLPIKILRKDSRKKPFLANIFNKFARKFPCNIRICSSVCNGCWCARMMVASSLRCRFVHGASLLLWFMVAALMEALQLQTMMVRVAAAAGASGCVVVLQRSAMVAGD